MCTLESIYFTEDGDAELLFCFPACHKNSCFIKSIMFTVLYCNPGSDRNHPHYSMLFFDACVVLCSCVITHDKNNIIL